MTNIDFHYYNYSKNKINKIVNYNNKKSLDIINNNIDEDELVDFGDNDEYNNDENFNTFDDDTDNNNKDGEEEAVAAAVNDNEKDDEKRAIINNKNFALLKLLNKKTNN